jgi:hypothetical protein
VQPPLQSAGLDATTKTRVKVMFHMPPYHIQSADGHEMHFSPTLSRTTLSHMFTPLPRDVLHPSSTLERYTLWPDETLRHLLISPPRFG